MTASIRGSKATESWWAASHAKDAMRTGAAGKKAGLRIRIPFIRIQHFRLNRVPIRIQGFNDQKFKKNYN